MEYRFTESNFDQEVLKSDIPVLVDFYADWCGPCKMMAPAVEQIADTYAGKVKVGKINVDENPDVAMRYGVQSIPNFKFFRNGQIVDQVIGAVGMEALEDKIDALLR